MEALQQFHPLIAKWFRDRLGTPTNVQALSWPKIAKGEHLLITAPTGSGKTLTAFLWAINQFVTGNLKPGNTRVLYISPLKALNNDIFRNLTSPLQELREIFEAHGREFPQIRAQTRSGDTRASDRRRMLRDPPEILITTPESLNLMLSSHGGLGVLHSVDTLILDEIHSVLDGKRGVYLMSAVERLVGLSGEFQRIALSATVKPLKLVAEFVAGYQLDSRAPVSVPAYKQRKITIVQSDDEKQYQVSIRYPQAAADRPADEKIWDSLAEDFYRKINGNNSTLLFANSRALCEKLTFKINSVAESTVAWAHHGSLAREIRSEVESRLKDGELSAIVATSSLELGIDIGALDEVVLIQAPDSISSAIQRIGRAGHRVGEVSRGTIYPTHPQDVLNAAVLSKAIAEKDIEPIHPVECPLDVLSQIIVSMTGTRTWNLDELFAQVRCSFAYHKLSREQFDLVVNMLTGRYADSRIAELRPKISIDRLNNTAVARKGALLSLYLSGGVIPDRGYFQLRHADNNARIGELDEEFVWEASVGKIFTFGTQYWQIQKITHNDVVVTPAKPSAAAPPFWKAESLSRNFHFSERIGLFLESLNTRMHEANLPQTLATDFSMEEIAAKELVTFLQRQKEFTGADLPHRHHLLIERTSSAPGKAAGDQLILHTTWGARVNRPWAMAMEAAWREKFGEQLEIHVTNECLVFQLPHDISVESMLSLAPAEKIESLLRQRLEGSGFFGARFRENAGRALLLSKGRFNERKPLWMSRLQSQKLLDSVLKYEDFPILLETWRNCLNDEFDLDNLQRVLHELDSGEIRTTLIVTGSPSPFAQNVAWEQINLYMYMDDRPKSDKVSNLHESLLQEVVFSPGLRPSLHADLVKDFETKLRRLIPGYEPDSAEELVDWVVERSLIPVLEWSSLLDLVSRRLGADALEEALIKASTRLVIIENHGTELVAPLENIHNLLSGLFQAGQIDIALAPLVRQVPLPVLPPKSQDEATAEELTTVLLANILQFYGPVTLAQLTTLLNVSAQWLLPALQDLLEEKVIIQGKLLAVGEEAAEASAEDSSSDVIRFCDARNFEILLRLARRSAIPEFEPLSLSWLPAFFNSYQKNQSQSAKTSSDEVDAVFTHLERLRCYPAAAGAWEADYLPARIKNYQQSLLDQMLMEGEFNWLGTGDIQISFCFYSDLDLMQPETDVPAPASQNESELAELLPDFDSRYDFNGLQSRTDWPAEKISAVLWRHVWSGDISNDTFSALRRGIANKFTVPGPEALTNSRRRSTRRGGFAQWKGSIPYAGTWFRVRRPEVEPDLLAKEERNRDRVRILLDRYGIVFREILHKELPTFRWKAVFRSLRLMELSGELIAGYFFKDIPGPQFISHEGFRLLQRQLPNEIFWLNAQDPVSLSGVQIDAIRGTLPRRVDSNHLVYHGKELVLRSERLGKHLTINVAPDHPDLLEYLGILKHLMYRSLDPIRHIKIRQINHRPAIKSDYLDVLRDGFDVVVDYKEVTLQRDL